MFRIDSENIQLVALIVTILTSLGAAIAFIEKRYLARFRPKTPGEQLEWINKQLEKDDELSESMKALLKEWREFTCSMN